MPIGACNHVGLVQFAPAAESVTGLRMWKNGWTAEAIVPIRERSGKWEWRFWVRGHEYSQITALAATERNKTAAMRMEAQARKLVLEGNEHLLKLQTVPFSEAAALFLTWAEAEHREHPGTAKRLRSSFSSALEFFGKRPVHAITAGDLEDYKARRRTVHGVREVSLRHDLHALSKFFRYAMRHNWCHKNPTEQVEIPSDADAVRIHVLTPAEEMIYFSTCLAKGYRDLHDLGRLMILQGCRPDELRSLEKANVDLERGFLRIAQGKSAAAKRTLRLTAESRSILAPRMAGSGKWIFPSPTKPGQHIGIHQRPHQVVLEDTGLAFVPYDLRHTFATRAADGGMPLATLAAVLGHGNLRSISKYVHVQQCSMDRELERMEMQQMQVSGNVAEGIVN